MARSCFWSLCVCLVLILPISITAPKQIATEAISSKHSIAIKDDGERLKTEVLDMEHPTSEDGMSKQHALERDTPPQQSKDREMREAFNFAPAPEGKSPQQHALEGTETSIQQQTIGRVKMKMTNIELAPDGEMTQHYALENEVLQQSKGREKREALYVEPPVPESATSQQYALESESTQQSKSREMRETLNVEPLASEDGMPFGEMTQQYTLDGESTQQSKSREMRETLNVERLASEDDMPFGEMTQQYTLDGESASEDDMPQQHDRDSQTPPTFAKGRGKREALSGETPQQSMARLKRHIRNVAEANEWTSPMKGSSLEWVDSSLQWNPSLFNGINTVQVTYDTVWTPEIFVINSVGTRSLIPEAKHVKVTASGRVIVMTPIILETYCTMDLSNYPFDTQTCPIKFGYFEDFLNWTWTDVQILSDRSKISNEWNVIGYSTKFTEIVQMPLPDLLLTLRRKTLFYTVCLVGPMIVASYMNSFVFLVPVQSGEKLSFLISIFVSSSVYFSFLSMVMPRGLNSVPLAVHLLFGVTAEGLVVLLLTIFILKRYHAQLHASASGNVPSGETAHLSTVSGTGSPETDEFYLDSTSSSLESTNNTGSSRVKMVRKISSSDAGNKAFSKSTCSPNSNSSATGINSTNRLFSSRSPKVVPVGSAHALHVRKRWYRVLDLSAQQFDWLFFVATFTCNTVFLFAMLYRPYSEGAYWDIVSFQAR